MFCNWTEQCRVRQVGPKYGEVACAAEAKGINMQDELHERGFRTYREFDFKCEKFRLPCRIMEMSELGSGLVLYFHFLRFLAAVLLMMAVVSLPAMVTYSREDSLQAWWWHDWRSTDWDDLEDHRERACSCIGSNRGFEGVGTSYNKSYGTSCAVWDLAWCKNGTSPPRQPGKWCCRSWCFASLGCDVPVERQSSLADSFHGGLVRSSSACEQDDDLLADACSDLEDVSFREGVQVAPSELTWKLWLTPGNMGPQRAEAIGIPFLYVFAVLLLCAAIVMMHESQTVTDRLIDVANTLPSDFGVLVHGLPKTATDEEEIADWFSKHALGDRPVDVAKVVIGFDGTQFREKRQRLCELREQLRELRDGSEAREKLLKEIEEVKDTIGSSLDSSGVAVVVLRFKQDRTAIVEKWSGLWKLLYRHSNGLLPGGAMPTFQDRQLVIKPAADPGDINWDDFGHEDTLMNSVKHNIIMLALVSVSFLITWTCSVWQVELRKKSAKQAAHEYSFGEDPYLAYTAYRFQALSLLPAACVSIVNFFLKMAAAYIAQHEYHHTLSEQSFSQAFKMTYAMVINTVGVMLWVNLQPREWYVTGGLVDDMIYMLIIDAVIGRLLGIIDSQYFVGAWTRFTLTDEKVNDLNNRLQSCHKGETPEQEEDQEQLKSECEAIKAAFEPMEWDGPARYAAAMTTFLLCIWYSPLLPLAPLIGFVGMVMQYMLDKLLVLRWNKRSRPATGSQALWSLRVLQRAAPLGLSISSFCFLVPSWKEPKNVIACFFMSGVLSLLVFLIPLSAWTRICCCRGCRLCANRYLGRQKTEDEPSVPSDDYYNAQYMWPPEMKYHKDQPLYKTLPKDKNPEMLGLSSQVALHAEDFKQARRTLRRRREDAASNVFQESEEDGARDATRGLRTQMSQPWLQPSATVYGTRQHPDSSVWPADLQAEVFGSAAGGSAVTWEFETNKGFEAFASDCQTFIERRFQEYRAHRGPHQMAVRTSGMVISVDVQRMTQKVANSHGKVREIRRREITE